MSGINFDTVQYLDCCGIKEYAGFWGEGGNRKVVLSKASIHTALLRVRGPHLPAIVLFSGADFQKDHPWSAYTFADWLKSQKEEVIETPEVKNPNSGRLIKAYMWLPSDKFRKDLKKVFLTKNKKKKNAKGLDSEERDI